MRLREVLDGITRKGGVIDEKVFTSSGMCVECAGKVSCSKGNWEEMDFVPIHHNNEVVGRVIYYSCGNFESCSHISSVAVSVLYARAKAG